MHIFFILYHYVATAFALASPPGDELSNRGEETPFVHVPLAHAADSDYASGKVHSALMQKLMAAVDRMRAPIVNAADPDGTPVFHPPAGLKCISTFTPCAGGHAGTEPNNTYACRNLDLYSFTPHAEMGSTERVGNDVWGWAHSAGGATREFGLVGQMDGTAFVEVLPSGQIAYLGRLPTQSVVSLWRDIKVIGHHAYIGSEAEGHGIQVFDLLKTFDIKTDLTSLYDGLPIGMSHNVVAHEAKNLLVAVGSLPRTDVCASGLIFIDVTDPSRPQSAGCAAADGYVHDAQCLTYRGPHTAYNGTDVCYSFNENSFTIYNITNPFAPVIISITSYYGVTYSHQGWVVDEKNQTHLLLNDEYDEIIGRGWAHDQRSVTYIWDIQNLERPVLTGHYKSPAVSIDHNLYVHSGLAYESNYQSGLRIVNVSSIAKDPTGGGFYEAAFFDVHPEDDDVNGIAEFGGAWSVYPYFESGYLLVNTLERGLFVVKYNESARNPWVVGL